jgi:hypothetical protein
MRKNGVKPVKSATTPQRRGRWKASRIAAALTHTVFIMVIALAFIRGGEPQATVKENPPFAEPLREPEQDTALLPGAASPEPLAAESAEPSEEAAQRDGEFELAQRSRRSRRREQPEEPPAEPVQPLPTPSRSPSDQARANKLMARLVATYPDFLTGHDDNNLIWRDGARMGFDDGAEKTFQERLERADIEDQFAIPYPLGEMLSDPEPDYDPGRFRNIAFLTKMYGDCRRRGEVRNKLVDVVWLPRHWGRKIKVTSLNGVAEKLQRVSDELDALPEEFQKYLRPIAGTFNCRDVTNTSRYVAHSFGIAVDINSAHGDYWDSRRRRSAEPVEYRNRIPNEIVAIFEKHGFIWGGKWQHFDTAHFEYRPELLIPDEAGGSGNIAVPMPVKQPRNLN